jgi:hypothetical protein
MDCVDHGRKGDKTGYTRTHVRGKTALLHRLKYAEAHGLDVLTMGGVVMHTCDNPRCINPAHLVLGTTASNNADCRDKGRHAYGERCGASVLTVEAVRTIRETYIPRDRERGARALARRFGVAHPQVLNVLRGKTWKEA